MGLRQVKVTGKGSEQRVIPVDRAFFAELGSYLRTERPERALDTGVLRRVARPDHRPGDDRGRSPANLPNASGPHRGDQGPPSPASATRSAPSWHPPASTCWSCEN